MTQAHGAVIGRGLARRIVGEVKQTTLPDWRPLLGLAGELAHWFAWLCEIGMDEGTAAHVYRHRQTGRLIVLTEADQAFACVGGELGRDCAGEYRPISRTTALLHAFDDWRELSFADHEFANQRRILDEALRSAARGERMPIDREWMARQSRHQATLPQRPRPISAGWH